MFNYFTSWVWGAQEETDAQGAVDTAAVEHSTREEAGEWVVVTTGAEPSAEKGSKSVDSTSQESECDRESVCSDGSWIVAPAPTFRVTGGTNSVSTTGHPLENLLIEHPTMSVYGQVPRRETPREGERERAQAQAREVVLLRNRQRYQVAERLQVPLGTKRNHRAGTKPKDDQLRVTRKAVRRHNSVRQRNGRGRQTLSVKKCSFVAGRRRC